MLSGVDAGGGGSGEVDDEDPLPQDIESRVVAQTMRRDAESFTGKWLSLTVFITSCS
jgi:hypothetical protein